MVESNAEMKFAIKMPVKMSQNWRFVMPPWKLTSVDLDALSGIASSSLWYRRFSSRGRRKSPLESGWLAVAGIASASIPSGIPLVNCDSNDCWSVTWRSPELLLGRSGGVEIQTPADPGKKEWSGTDRSGVCSEASEDAASRLSMMSMAVVGESRGRAGALRIEP